MKNFTGPLRKAPLVCLLLFSLTDNVRSQSHPLWGDLHSGPYAVGFKSLWRFDFSRTYNTTFEDKTTYATGKAPRPILINVWYPAKKAETAKAMLQRDYLRIKSSDPQLRNLSERLAEFNRGVIVVEVMGKPEKQLSDGERDAFEQFLSTPTAAVRDAQPEQGKFPLLVYHQGSESSLEDNSVLCEYLASHGYVVINSAYQDEQGTSLAIEGLKGWSAGDLEFLISYASQLPNVDWHRIAIVGHSIGAQRSMVFASRSASVVDAVVSLDTTQDYWSINHKLFELFTSKISP